MKNRHRTKSPISHQSTALPSYTDSIDVMGTRVTVQVVSDLGQTEVQDKIDQAFNPFFQVVNRFSRFKDDNELAQLNKSSGERAEVSKELFEMLTLLLQVAKVTRGFFDPTVIDFLEGYGYDKDYRDRERFELGDPKRVNILEARPSYSDINLYPKVREIQLAKGQKLDLGAIGKGYAIDLAFEELKPLENFCINAGGDIRASGYNPERESWKAGLKDPTGKSDLLGAVELRDEALASSGPAARRKGKFHHLINPKTGKPIKKLRATFVKAPTATLADVLATAFFVSDQKGQQALESEFPEAEFLKIN